MSVADTVVDESTTDEAYAEEAEEMEEDSIVDQPENSTAPTEEDVTMLERV